MIFRGSISETLYQNIFKVQTPFLWNGTSNLLSYQVHLLLSMKTRTVFSAFSRRLSLALNVFAFATPSSSSQPSRSRSCYVSIVMPVSRLIDKLAKTIFPKHCGCPEGMWVHLFPPPQSRQYNAHTCGESSWWRGKGQRGELAQARSADSSAAVLWTAHPAQQAAFLKISALCLGLPVG